MKRLPHGFTLVELLVVITIIGMLVGMLLPAINMAREVARRATCTSNLHQLSTACLGHAQKLNFFPSGGWGSSWVGFPDNGAGPSQPGGWIYQILPYMDQDYWHDLGKGAIPPDTTASATRVANPMKILYCPTRRSGDAYPVASSSPGGANPSAPNQTDPLTVAGRTDYAINGGSVYIAHGAGPASLSAAQGYTWPSLASFNGIASVHSQISLDMIPDSKGTTYLLGEKYMSPENYTTGMDTEALQDDPGDLFSAMSGDDVSLIRWGNASYLPSMDRTASNHPPPNPSRIFGSAHGAGWHAAFCDGHVQLIGWSIDPTTHQAMATRNGHEVVDPTLIPK
jgi:prepilin-type N-terminal cleavage/methylation domain-containing protein